MLNLRLIHVVKRICLFDPWIGKIPWRRDLQPTPAFLPGKSHGQRSLVGHSPGGCKGLDTTERLTCSLPFFSRIVSASTLHRYVTPLLVTECYSAVWMVRLVFTHLPLDGYLDCFQLLAVLGNATAHWDPSFCADVCFHVS